jgi:hypothetical protein
MVIAGGAAVAQGWLTLGSTLLGGIVALSGAYVLDGRNRQSQRRERWDERRIDAVISLCVAAQDWEGAHYRRGRAIQDRREAVALRIEDCDNANRSFRAAAASVDLLFPEIAAEVATLRSTTRDLRDLADSGLEARAPAWIAARDTNRSAILSLQAAARRHIAPGFA